MQTNVLQDVGNPQNQRGLVVGQTAVRVVKLTDLNRTLQITNMDGANQVFYGDANVDVNNGTPIQPGAAQVFRGAGAGFTVYLISGGNVSVRVIEYA